ncbi:non-specific lipid-transfer protein 2-like [Panicum virgatum]|nr:non-specific lipid-transfer protein 2-like [Panicum virgatum]
MAPPLYASSAIMSAATLLLAVLAAARDHDACETAQQAFSEGVPYVVGQAPAASPNCCTGLGDLRDMGGSGAAAAAAQRRALCACVLSEVKAAGAMDPRRAAGLAAACKVPVGFIPTKPGFDCSA